MTMRDDDVMRELEAALDVKPSADFASDVRARVVASRTRTRRLQMSIAGGLAIAAAVVLMVWGQWTPAPTMDLAGEPAQTVAVARTPAAASMPLQEAATNATDHESATPSPRALVRTTRARPPSEASSLAAKPEYVVVTNQLELLTSLWAAAQEPGAVVVADAAERQGPTDTETRPIAIEPLTVAPIVVTKIVDLPVSGGASPVIRRMAAERESR